ncbi:hypothetical protein FACS1894217_13830 [Clostridia bacterium]|nr:hypothetical protein FACS1894217_13830 [Clostridia bacterium]
MNIVESIIAIAALGGAIITIWNLIDKVIKPIKEINSKLDSFQTWQKNQQLDIESSKEEREILCRGFRALCIWTISQGANGEVHKALEDLNSYLSRQAHEGKSYLRERS